MRSIKTIIAIKLPLVALLLLITIGSVYGQGKNFFIVPKDPAWIVKKDIQGARPADKDISDGYFLSFYESQNHVELQQEYSHLVREIVSDAGVQNGSQISVTYDPAFQKLTFHKVTLWRNNKPYNQLNLRKFKILQSEKELSKFIYSGTYEAFLLVEDVRKGDRIEYAYTLEGQNPIFGKKFSSEFYFEGASSIGHIYTNLIFKDRHLQLKNFNFSQGPKTSKKDGFTLYEWEDKLTKTHRVTDFEPSWYNPLKRTQITEFESWNDVVNWGLAINDYPNLKTPLLDEKVAEFKKKSYNDPKKYIILATKFVQDEIRYMGIEIGQYSHKPNSPEKVMEQRYGDCKDKSLLLVHFLAAMNINAYMAYVDTYSNIKTAEYLPSPFVFNHVVVVVEYQNNKTWIDPTIAYQRGNFKNIYFPNYGDALVIKKGVNKLEKVISIPSGKAVSVLDFNIADTTEGNKSTLIIKTIYTDNYADDMRSEIAESGTDGLEKSYLEYYAKQYAEIEAKAPLQIKDNEETNTLEVIESYEISDIWLEDQERNQRYVAFYADMVGAEMRSITAKNRKTPISLKYPSNIEQTIIVHAPRDWRFNTDSFSLENDDYYFEQTAFQHGRDFTLNYVYRNMKAYIDASKAKTYVKDSKKINDNLSYYMYWGETNASSDLSPIVTIIALLTIIISGIFFTKLYQKESVYDLDQLLNAKKIRGWLIFFKISVFLGPFSLLYMFSKMESWSSNNWQKLSSGSTFFEYAMKGLFIVDLISFAILFSFSIMLIFSFINRRKEFPKLYIIFLFAYTFLSIIDLSIDLLSNTLDKDFGITGTIISTIIGLLINLICILYLKKSQYVKETFVFTYPELEWKMAMIKTNYKNENI